jgi:hypothetical protein
MEEHRHVITQKIYMLKNNPTRRWALLRSVVSLLIEFRSAYNKSHAKSQPQNGRDGEKEGKPKAARVSSPLSAPPPVCPASDGLSSLGDVGTPIYR